MKSKSLRCAVLRNGIKMRRSVSLVHVAFSILAFQVMLMLIKCGVMKVSV